jgi:hypothetical protein
MDSGNIRINLSVQHLEFTSNRLQRVNDASEKVASPVNEASLRPGARCSPRVVWFVVAGDPHKERCQRAGALSDVLPAFDLPKALVLPVSSCVGCIGFTGKRS